MRACLLAVTMYAQRRLEAAAAEYGEVAELRTAALGADHPDTKRARTWQVRIQRELGPSPQ